MLVIGEENDENVGYDSMVLSAGMGKAFTDMQRLRSRVLKFAKHMRSFDKDIEEFESGMHECKRVWLKKMTSTNHEEPPKYSPNKEYNNMRWREEEEELNPNHHADNPYPTIERQTSNEDPLSFSSRGELVNRHPKKAENYNGVYGDEDDEFERQTSNKDPLSFSSRGELVNRHPKKAENYNGVYSDEDDEFDSFDTDLEAAPRDMVPQSNGFSRFALNAKLSDDEVHFSALQTPPRGESENLPTSLEMEGWGRKLGHSYGFSKYLDLASVEEEDETFDYTIHDF